MANASELEDDQIRVVSILDPGSDKTDLHVSRRHIIDLPTWDAHKEQPTPTTEPYIALSYVWGQERSRVLCDDTILEVSSHLIPALRQLHQHYPASLFWTDSICIDQQNPGEKAHQVGMMGQIFAGADTVAVWLGEDSDDIFDSLHDPSLNTQADEESVSQARVALLRRLAENPWFYRAWTFQEIRVATKAVVMLGTKVMPWADFIRGVAEIRAFEPRLSSVTIRSQPRSYSQFKYQPQDQFFSILGELQSVSRSDLASLLYTTWYREATVKHDKVYALLSDAVLSGPGHGISIDYDIAWSTLCIKAARACLNNSHSLMVLKVAGMKQRWKSPVTNRWDSNELNHLLSHPSWAPDWYEPPQQMRSISSFTYDQRSCFAPLDFCCPTLCPEQQMQDTSPFLVLKGVVLGIMNLGDPPSWSGGPTLVHPPPQCAVGEPRQWLENPHRQEEPRSPLDAVEKVFMSRFVEEVHAHLHGKCYCASLHMRGGDSRTALNPMQHHNPNPWEKVNLHFGQESFSIHHVATKVGGGTASESEHPAEVIATSVESGDWLVLLEGGGTPFVLRPIINHMGHAQRSYELTTPEERARLQMPDDAACFVLVGEASMCWDQLWPDKWSTYCRAGNFVIV